MTTTASQEYGVGCHVHSHRLIAVVTNYPARRRAIQRETCGFALQEHLRLFTMLPDERLPEHVRMAVIVARQAWGDFRRYCQASTPFEVWGDDLDAIIVWPDRMTRAKHKLLDDEYGAKHKLLDDAIVTHMPALIALHDELCVDCPWDEKQQTIFPTKVTP